MSQGRKLCEVFLSCAPLQVDIALSQFMSSARILLRQSLSGSRTFTTGTLRVHIFKQQQQHTPATPSCTLNSTARPSGPHRLRRDPQLRVGQLLAADDNDASMHTDPHP